MIGCERLTLCWVAWNATWPHLTICLILVFSLVLAYWQEIRAGSNRQLRTVGVFGVTLLIPLAISILAIAFHFHWRKEPPIGEILRFFTSQESLFFIYLFITLSFIGGVSYLLVRQRAAIPPMFWTGAVRARTVMVWSLLPFAAVLITYFVGYRLGYSPTDQSADFIRAVRTQDSVLIRNLMLVGASLLGPIVEECFFRGLIQPKLIEQIGPVAGIIMQSVLFSLVHLHFDGKFLVIMITGVILGASFYFSKSLFSPIAVHITNNSLASYMLLVSA